MFARHPSFTEVLRDESGQDLIEYALLAFLVSLGAIASMRTLAGTISQTITHAGTALTNDI